MNYFLEMFKEKISSNHLILFYIFILLFSLFKGNIVSLYVTNGTKKILSSRHKIVEELKCQLIKEVRLEENLTECNNCLVKAQIYLMLSIAILVQLIKLLVVKNVNIVDTNVCMLTLTISLMEFRDNIRIWKHKDNEIHTDTKKIIRIIIDLDELAIQDIVYDDLEKDKIITKEKRLELINNNK